MIEPDDRPPEGEEVGLKCGVVRNEDCRTVEYLRRVSDILDVEASHLRSFPEGSDGRVPRVVMAYDVPTLVTPPDDDISHVLKVMIEGRGSFWYSGEICIPVKGHGYGGWLYLTPQIGVPRIKTWRTNNEGRLVRVPSCPPVGGFLVRYEESYRVVVSVAPGVVRGNRMIDPDVGLPRSVFDVNHWISWKAFDVGVPGDDQIAVGWRRHPCPSAKVVAAAFDGESIPDWEYVISVVRKLSD